MSYNYYGAYRYHDGSGAGVVPFVLSEDTARFIQWYQSHFSMDPAIILFRSSDNERWLYPVPAKLTGADLEAIPLEPQR